MSTLAETIAAEQAAIAAGAPACGYSCACHGGPCIRTVHPNYGDHVDDQGKQQPETRVPHVAKAADGSLVQFNGPHLTADQLAAQATAAQAEQVQFTKTFLDGLDPATARAWLTGLGVMVAAAPVGS